MPTKYGKCKEKILLEKMERDSSKPIFQPNNTALNTNFGFLPKMNKRSATTQQKKRRK